MEITDFTLVEMIGRINEDMDTDKIEERFFELVSARFGFDRTALFFLKHRRGMLHGKLSSGFPPGLIQGAEIPVKDNSLLARPLITGMPFCIGSGDSDTHAKRLGLSRAALIPIVNNKRVSCWERKNCNELKCPAYGEKWVRCWLVRGTRCGGEAAGSIEEKAGQCSSCPIFESFNLDATEGVLVADNSVSGRPITRDAVTLIYAIAHAVGMAINNAKIYRKTLDVAIKDPLTSLHNRRYFDERLSDEVDRASRYGESLSLVMCDIDHFKRVNDDYGHPVGDEVLRWVADIFRKSLRKADMISRYGGEEFAIILLNTGREQASAIAEKLRRGIEESHFLYRESRIPITLSFGVSSFGVDSRQFAGLIESADRALYKAKSQGRNRVCVL